jgi:hypothetical protein
MSDWPTLKEELDRKTLDALEWLDGAHERGEIDDHALGAGAHAIFTAVMGLVDKDISEIVTQLSAKAPRKPPVLQKIFANSKGLVVKVVMRARSERVTLMKGSMKGLTADKDWRSQNKTFDDHMDAREWFKELDKKLQANGYVRID